MRWRASGAQTLINQETWLSQSLSSKFKQRIRMKEIVVEGYDLSKQN